MRWQVKAEKWPIHGSTTRFQRRNPAAQEYPYHPPRNDLHTADDFVDLLALHAPYHGERPALLVTKCDHLPEHGRRISRRGDQPAAALAQVRDLPLVTAHSARHRVRV